MQFAHDEGMIFNMEASADLRTTFNEYPEQYNLFRPTYPDRLFDALVTTANITNTSKLLEIGPGTGQATKPLAQLGADITGIELGAELAEKARTELQQYPNVRITTGSFEAAALPDSSYDLIFSATAFHWIEDEDKFLKAARLLKPEGWLAIIHTEHVSDDNGDEFYQASQSIYSKYWPSNTAPLSPPSMDQLRAPYIDEQLFELKSFTVFPETLVYSAAEYAGLLSTYSPTIALPPDKRQGFLADIASLITERFGNRLEKQFAFTLAIAQKK